MLNSLESPKLKTISGVLFTLFLAILIIYFGVLISNKLKAYDYIGKSAEEIHSISISGEGVVAAVPDIAQVDLGIRTHKLTVAEAQKENTTKMNDLIKELKGLDIEKEDLKTTNYNVFPQYKWDDGKKTLIGYRVDQNLQVKIRNLDKVNQVLSKAAEKGVNDIGSLNFTIDDQEKLLQEAREKAIKNAQEKAETLAQTLKIKLGRIISFNEYQDSGDDYYYGAKQAGLSLMEESEALPQPDIQMGESEITVNVSINYEIL